VRIVFIFLHLELMNAPLARLKLLQALLFEAIIIVYVIAFFWLNANTNSISEKSLSICAPSIEQLVLLESTTIALLKKSCSKYIGYFDFNLFTLVVNFFKINLGNCKSYLSNHLLLNISLICISTNAP
jgi:hypothetical protein